MPLQTAKTGDLTVDHNFLLLTQEVGLLRSLVNLEIRAFVVIGTTGAVSTDVLGNAGVSVARTAAGRYTATWTRPWANGNYVVVGSATAGASGIGIWSLDGGVAYNSTGFGFMTINSTAFADLNSFCIAAGPRAA